MYFTGTMKINEVGHLEVGGVDALDLAKEFGTPLWVMDEAGFRQNCRTVRDAFAELGDSLVIYASKTLCNLSILSIVDQEGLGLDVASGGELYSALQAGFPMNKVYLHGNNKTPAELDLAVESGIGRIVVDNFYELQLLNSLCARKGKKQDIMLRITPGVEAHTHEFIRTGQIDSKFGFTLPDGQALEAVRAALDCPHLNLIGLHCHIGSQIFEMESFKHATELMMGFLNILKQECRFEAAELDMGGGFGIYYFYGDEPRDPREWAGAVMNSVFEKCREYGLKIPRVIVEPGRSLAGPAGITLYTVGSYKEVKGIRKYIAVDGGMTDNPRPALYGSQYLAMLANKAAQEAEETVSIAGKCCESGDMLIWDAKLPRVEPGDILAVFATGAYNYAMSMNYNRVPRPAMALVGGGRADLILKRESYADLIRNDVLLERFKR